MYYAIEKVIKNGLKIILVTNCQYGGIYTEYGGLGGNQSLKDLGVIMADDLNPYQGETFFLFKAFLNYTVYSG